MVVVVAVAVAVAVAVVVVAVVVVVVVQPVLGNYGLRLRVWSFRVIDYGLGC